MAGDSGGSGVALVVGESLVDVVAREDGTRTWLPGGSCANVAVALARLGHETRLATALGEDAMGRLLRDHLAASGVRLTVTHAARTSSALATLDASGAARYEFDLVWELDPDAVAVRPLVVHTGSIGAVLEPGASAVRRLLDRLRPAATVSYDVNARPALMGGREHARRRVEQMVARSDLVKASDEDLGFLYPGSTAEKVASEWLRAGPVAVAVTRGADGADGFLAGQRVHVPAVPVPVVDTIGAGDTFSAGLVDALWRGGLLGARPRALTAAQWRAALAHAGRLAAVTVSRRGADPPWGGEVRPAGPPSPPAAAPRPGTP